MKVVAGLLIALITFGCSDARSTRSTKLIVLGADGFDPDLFERYAAEGRLPNLTRLMKEGRYMRLATSNPPQSPVAWSNFITGRESDAHGIYDFVHRDPWDRRPYLSTSRTEPPRILQVGSYAVPVGGGGVELLRKGRAFWELLADHGVKSTIFKVPANYPPSASGESRAVSGMGTPDLLGTYGTFQVFTDDRELAQTTPSGGRIHFLDFAGTHTARTVLHGPPNPFELDHPPLSAPVEVVVDRTLEEAVLSIGDNILILRQGEWSGWLPVSFTTSPFAPSLAGIVRAYLASAGSRVLVYITPINVDPMDPALPISTDEEYLEALTSEVGRFYTQGMPEDTKALEAGILSDAQFLEQAELVFSERKRLLDWHLDHFDSGLLFFYFSSTDQVSHVFYRSIVEDARPEDVRFAHVIPSLYERMDRIVGEVVERLDQDTELVIMSDHGFAPWTWEVNVNAWLRMKGYLVTYPGRTFRSGAWSHVNWVETKAYAVGLNQIFINLEGRERSGFVQAHEREPLRRKIAKELEALRDPKTGARVVTNVYLPEPTEHPDRTPDLIVGYARGYRSSNASAVGDTSGPIIARNDKKWSGDHCMDPSHVPGVLFTTATLTSTTGKLTDIAASVLDYFDVPLSQDVRGRRLLSKGY